MHTLPGLARTFERTFFLTGYCLRLFLVTRNLLTLHWVGLLSFHRKAWARLVADTDVTQRDGFTTPVTSDFCCCSNQFEPVTVEFRRVVRNNDTTKTAVYWNLYSPIMSYWFHIYIDKRCINIYFVCVYYVPRLPPTAHNKYITCSFRNFDRFGLVGLCHAMLLKRGLPFWKKHFRFELQLWCPGITPQNWNRRSPTSRELLW